MRALCATALLAAASAAGAQTAALQGTLGNKALLIVDGSAPRAVAAGETHRNVKVLSVSGDQATVEIAGQRLTLRVGEQPAHVGGAAAPRSDRIVLTASSGGHFMSQGHINGRPAVFMVDTGATSVAIGSGDATRLGIDYRKGVPGRAHTPNGVTQTWRVKLDSLRIGETELYNLDAVVVPTSMPYVLLGNNFLSRFQMRRDNDLMVLERRY